MLESRATSSRNARATSLESARIPELVAELVRLKVDVLVAGSSPVALAAKNATQTIPITMFAGDPVGLGLVGSLARPGADLTGLSYFNVELKPSAWSSSNNSCQGLTRVAVLRNPMITIHAIFWQRTEVAARKLGVGGQVEHEGSDERRSYPYPQGHE